MVRSQSSTKGWLTLALGLMVTLNLLTLSGVTVESIQRRVEAIPFYVQSYLNKFRPKAELPPPPVVSAVAPERLLQSVQQASEATNRLPTQTTNTPAYFNEVSLNPTNNQFAGGGAIHPAVTKTVEQTATDQPSTHLIKPIAPQVALTGITHQWQTWNNCGPVTITMNLSYFGRTETQVDSAPFLKPNEADKNVSPHELAAYAQRLGYGATVRVGGDIALLKQLLSNDLPVIAETWLNPEDNGGLGHYRLLTGYSEMGGYFIAQDSLNGSNIQIPFVTLDQLWQVFNRTYILVYPPDQMAIVQAILGARLVDQSMYEAALLTAQMEAQADPTQAYAWFNIGSNYARLGQPDLAASAFDEARRIGLPYRMLWYQFDISESYLAVGRYQAVIDLNTALLKATGGLEELYYYRGLARQALGQIDQASSDFRAALEYNANFRRASEALAALGVS